MTCLKHSVLWHCWLGNRKGIRPVKTEWWGTGMVVCLERGANDLPMPLPPPSSLAPVKSSMVYLSGASLPRFSWKKGWWTNVVLLQMEWQLKDYRFKGQWPEINFTRRTDTVQHMSLFVTAKPLVWYCLKHSLDCKTKSTEQLMAISCSNCHEHLTTSQPYGCTLSLNTDFLNLYEWPHSV